MSEAGPETRPEARISAAGDRERVVKRGWATPGGAHDRLIRVLKIALPALIGVVLAFLAFAPLEDKQEVSFLLDKNKVETAHERLKVSSAEYRGQDDQRPAFVLTPARRCSRLRASQVVDIRDMNAQIQLDSGPGPAPGRPRPLRYGARPCRRRSARSPSPPPTATGWTPATSTSICAIIRW